MLKLLKNTFFLFLICCLSSVELKAQENFKIAYPHKKQQQQYTRTFSKHYLLKSEKKDNKSEHCIRYFKDYDSLIIKNDLKKAEIAINELIRSFQQNNLPVCQIEALFRKGVLLLKLYNDSKEINTNDRVKCYTSIYEIAKNINDLRLQYWARIWLAIIKADVGDYTGGIKEFESVLAEIKLNYEKLDYTEKFYLLSEIYRDLAFYHLKIRNLEKASYYLDLGFKHYTNSKSPDKIYNKNKFMHYHYKYTGELYFLKGNYDAAENYYIKAISYKTNRDNLAKDSIQYLGKIAFAKQDFKKAILYLSIFEKPNYNGYTILDKTFLNDAYKYLGLSYKAIKNYEKANHYLEKYIGSISQRNQYKDSVYAKFNSLEIENAKKELDAIQTLEQQKTNYIYYLLMIIWVCAIAVTYYIFNLKNQNQKKFNKLINKIQDLEKEKTNTKPNKNGIQSLKDSEVERILKALVKFEHKEGFLSTGCTLSSTAKKLKTNTTYLSKIINSEHQKTFNAYITELRINYAIKRLKDDDVFRKYSILAIANEIGYKSKESFNKAFKSSTGIRPSYFIKQLEEKHRV